MADKIEETPVGTIVVKVIDGGKPRLMGVPPDGPQAPVVCWLGLVNTAGGIVHTPVSVQRLDQLIEQLVEVRNAARMTAGTGEKSS